MSAFQPNKIRVPFALLLLLLVLSGYGQDTTAVISSPEHLRTLNEFRNKAEAYCAKNLNRFGLDELKKYDKALDSLFAQEKRDTLAAIQKNYSITVDKHKTENNDLNTQLNELGQAKESFTDKYHRLLRKAGIAFFIWLIVVLLLLSWRRRLVRKSQLELDTNLAQIKTTESNFADGEELFRLSGELSKKNTAIQPVVTEIKKLMSVFPGKLTAEQLTTDPFKSFQKNTEAIQTISNRLNTFNDVIRIQHEEAGEEKKLTNINQLCDQYTEFAYFGVLQDDGTFACQFSKDFEKNLPSVKIIPETVGSLLLNIMENAFQSVNDKLKMEIKGYVPKVSVSTRILPRFVQIRIKDNGDGIPDEVLEHVYDPFYSTRSTGEGAGLGLFLGLKIMKENNGEIKIESEKGNGTDVYLKFFLAS